MRTLPKSLLASGAAALLLGGCAVYPDSYYGYNDPYYDRTYYDRPYYHDYGPRYYSGPGVYVAPPAVSLGFSYHRGWRRR